MQELLEKVSRLRVLVVGDIILDHYIWGDASRISPEAPVPVVAVDRDTYALGAAANVALNLTSLGAWSELCGVIGDDDAGRQVRELLAANGVGLEVAAAPAAPPTIVKTRVVVRNQQLCRLDREEAPPHYRPDIARHADLIAGKVGSADAVILSDYAKGVVTPEVIRVVQDAAREKGVFVAYDPKPKSRLEYRGFDLMTPNRPESLQLAGIELGPHEDYPAEEVCRRIYERYAPARLIITLGAGGMLLSEPGSPPVTVPAYALEVFDVSGAGDTSIAALTLALAAGAPMSEAAHFANTAAGVVVGKFGTATATPEELLARDSAQ